MLYSILNEYAIKPPPKTGGGGLRSKEWNSR